MWNQISVPQVEKIVLNNLCYIFFPHIECIGDFIYWILYSIVTVDFVVGKLVVHTFFDDSYFDYRIVFEAAIAFEIAIMTYFAAFDFDFAVFVDLAETITHGKT